MRRKLSQGIAVVAVAVTITGGVAGCGVVNKLSAKQKVSKAVSSFQDAQSASFTLRLDTTSADIKKISAAEGDPLTADDQQIIDKILAGDVQYAVQAADGKKLGDSGNAATSLGDLNQIVKDPAKLGNALKTSGNFAFAVHLSGNALVEFRFVKGVFYGRADVSKILDLAGQDQSVVDDALADLPASLAPIRNAAKGQWVSLDLPATIQALKEAGAFDALSSTSAPTPSIDTGAVQKLITDLKAAYESKVTITELGDSDRGQEYQLSASPKQVAAAVQDDVIKIVGSASATDVTDGIAQIPDKPVKLNVWVKDDKLTGVALDLTQFFDQKIDAKLALDVDIKLGAGQISAPSGAAALDVKAVINEFQSSVGDFGGGSSGDSTDPFSDLPSDSSTAG